MEADQASGKARSAAAYAALLKETDPGKSDGAIGQIVRREAKRIFGGPLGRAKTRRSGKQGRPGGGRQPSRERLLLREKIAKDRTADGLREPAHYVRWLVDQPGVKMGLKPARTLAYSEMRRAR